jgi:hypothetical protein
MGVEEIIERIRQDTAAEVERIRREAADEEARILREERAATERAAGAIVAEGEREAERLRRRVLARARLSARGRLRACREAAISRAFEEAGRGSPHSSLRRVPPPDPSVCSRRAGGRGGRPFTVLCQSEDRGAVSIACSTMDGSRSTVPAGREGEYCGVVVVAGTSRCDQRFTARTRTDAGGADREGGGASSSKGRGMTSP